MGFRCITSARFGIAALLGIAVALTAVQLAEARPKQPCVGSAGCTCSQLKSAVAGACLAKVLQKSRIGRPNVNVIERVTSKFS
jgi:hypothetical protein